MNSSDGGECLRPAVSGAAPWGARWACLLLVLCVWGLVEYFIFFLRYFLIARIPGKEKKNTEAMKAL